MMGSKGITSIASISNLLLSFVSIVHSAASVGAPQDGGGTFTPGKDNTQALLDAWKAACAAGSTVTIPKGTYPLGQVTLSGPCQGQVTLNIQGTLQAPADIDALNDKAWIILDHVDGLTISGGGTLDGQGQSSWKTCGSKCDSGTISNLYLNFVTNSMVDGITSLNSKNFHISMLGCQDVTFQNLKITAPADSPNTDGIHIGASSKISILKSTIGTGDDCISIGDGASGITIEGVTCGPGHGISIGSLGKYPNEKPVTGVTVKGCTLSNTDNGVRLKSWPGRYAGAASDIHFEDITMSNVGNPIIIDQTYCPGGSCPSSTATSKVKFSGVTFSGIKGTSKIPEAVSLKCSEGQCSGITLNNIALTYNGGAPKTICQNVKPTIVGSVPAGC